VEKVKSKIIIHNYTDFSEIEIISYIDSVIRKGKMSETKQGKQYPFISTFSCGTIVACTKRKNTHTFKVWRDEIE